MIELMVTIGIILILMTIVLVAVKHVGRSATENATKVDLQNMQSMLAELEIAGPLTTTLAPINPAGNIPAPADVSEQAYSTTSTGTADTDPNVSRWRSPAVAQTQIAVGRMRSIPANRSAIQALPGERFMKKQAEGKDYSPPIITSPVNVHGTPDPPILVDAWNNPMIFVPGGGLNVAMAYDGTRTYKQGSVVSSGSNVYYRALKANTGAAVSDTNAWEQLPANFNPLVTAPGNRPFFASAGPDGDFQSPDDNMYSFEQ